MDFSHSTTLGGTGLSVGRMGVASGYGAPTEAFEEAFERGCNYFYWGSRRTDAMAMAIRNLSSRRDELVIVIQTYSRSARLMESFFQKGLKSLGLDRAEVMLLGWHNTWPKRKIIDRALEMRDKGYFKFLALSGHNRPLFADLARDGRFDIFHLRYNAAHRGAEEEIFPHLPPETKEGGPGVVTYTATRWGGLMRAKWMPPGEAPPSAVDCYRFVLSNPAVDVVMTGPKNLAQMRENLGVLSSGPMDDAELTRMRRIGDHVHGHGKVFW